jgi:hypothetical protein
LADEPARLLNDAVSTLLQRKMEYGFERESQIALIHRNQCSLTRIAGATVISRRVKDRAAASAG